MIRPPPSTRWRSRVKAHGGSIDTASIVGVNGLLLVNSGYGMFGQAPGNVMLAFKPKSGR